MTDKECSSMTILDDDTRQAMADQHAAMIEDAAGAESRGKIFSDLGYRGTGEMLQKKAADLRANAERLKARTEARIDMIPSISKHNGMVTP